MELFDPVVVTALEQRFRNWRPHERPKLFEIATASEYEVVRAWMHKQLSRLVSGHERLVHKLHDPKSFTDAFHELCVASVLIESKCTVAYEPALGAVTPDLLVHSADLATPLLVEVWTRNRPEEGLRRERQWWALKRRLEQIPVPVRLVVLDGPGAAPAPDDSAVSKRIAREVRRWLLSPATRRAGVCLAEGYKFAIVGQVDGLYLKFETPSGAGSVAHADQVLAAIKTKVDKYRDVAVTSDAELVVVLAAAGRTALSEDMLRGTLSGRNIMAMSFNAADIGVLGQVHMKMRSDDTAPSLDPTLSAVGWLAGSYANPPGRLSFYLNATARRPLRAFDSDGITVNPA